MPVGLRALKTVVVALAACLIAAAGIYASRRRTATGQTVGIGGSAQVHFPHNLTGLPGEPFRLVFDHHGNLWFCLLGGTRPNRLYEYNTSTRSFLGQWPLPHEPGNGFLSSLTFAPDGALWLGWNYVILRFDPATGRSTRWHLPPLHNRLTSTVQGSYVTGLAVTPDGVVWIARDNGRSITRFDPASGTFREIALSGIAGDPFGITVLPSGKLLFTIQRTLGVRPNFFVRMVEFDPRTAATSVIDTPGSSTVVSTKYGVLAAGATSQIERVGGGALATDVVKDPPSFPHLRADRENRLWFVARQGREIDAYDPSTGALSRFPIPLEYGTPGGPGLGKVSARVANTPLIGAIEPSAAGRIWFSIANYREIGYVAPAS